MAALKSKYLQIVVLSVFLIGFLAIPSAEGFFLDNFFHDFLGLRYDFESPHDDGFKENVEEDRVSIDDADSDETDFSIFETGSSATFHSSLHGFFDGFWENILWWKGPNVCVEREQIDDNTHQNKTKVKIEDDDDAQHEKTIFGSFNTCEQTDYEYRCTSKIHTRRIHRTYIVTYKCCHGYGRVRGQSCTELNMKGLLETATDLGGKDFVELIRTAGLEEKVSTDNLTLFVPIDDAVRDFSDSIQEANQVEFYIPSASARRRRSPEMEYTNMKDVVLGHIVSGIKELNSYKTDKVLYTDNHNSTIRTDSHFDFRTTQRITIANCAKVISTNNLATNGIVHVVDRVLRPVTKTLAELIGEDSKFSTLKSLLSKTKLMKLLENPGEITLFAPSDSAFENLDPVVKSRLLNGEVCAENVLRHHLSKSILCSAKIEAHVRAVNMDDEIFHFELTEDDEKLLVSGVQIVAKDIVGTNGVIHVVDGIIMPDSALPVTGVLASHNLTKFASLLQEAGLSESLDSMKNVTLFVPTDAALSEPEAVAELKKVRDDKDKLRDLLLYHTTGPEVHACDFFNDKELKSGFEDKSIRINLYAPLPLVGGAITKVTAQCAKIIGFDNRACGGVIHEIDRLMVPPTGSISDIIDKGEQYTVLKKLLEGTELKKELGQGGPYTFLAPTDYVFHKLQEEDLKRLTEDKELVEKVLRMHTITEALCCSGITKLQWPFNVHAQTLSGVPLTFRKHEGMFHIGSSMVLECDIPATNGLIHEVDKIMLEPDHKPNINIVLPRPDAKL